MEPTYPTTLTLKGGGSVQLRPVQDGDEPVLIEFFRNLPPEATEFLRDDVKDPEVVRRFVKQRDTSQTWAILALAHGKVVGDATLHMYQHGWRRHLGEVRVVVAPEFQHQRLARSLIHALVNHAGVRELRKLEAQILDTQEGARRAFEHLGFREEARLKDHAMDLNGRLHDLLIMTNTVEDLWKKMEDMISDMDLARDGY